MHFPFINIELSDTLSDFGYHSDFASTGSLQLLLASTQQNLRNNLSNPQQVLIAVPPRHKRKPNRHTMFAHKSRDVDHWHVQARPDRVESRASHITQPEWRLIQRAWGNDHGILARQLVGLGSQGDEPLLSAQPLRVSVSGPVLDQSANLRRKLVLVRPVLPEKGDLRLAVDDDGLPALEDLGLLTQNGLEVESCDSEPMAFESLSGFAHGGDGARAGAVPRERRDQSDRHSSRGFGYRAWRLRVGDRRWVVVSETENVGKEFEVVGAAGEEAERVECRRDGLDALERDGVVAWLHGEDAGVGGGSDHAAAGLGAQGERNLEVGNRGGGSARRTSRGARGVMGIGGLGPGVGDGELGRGRFSWQ